MTNVRVEPPNDRCRLQKQLLVVLFSGVLASLSAIEASAADQQLYRWDFDTPADIDGWEPTNGIKQMRVDEGRLWIEPEAKDVFIVLPVHDVPLDGCAVRLRIRTDRNASTQVYWIMQGQTDFDEQRQLTEYAYGSLASSDPSTDEGFRTLTFPISRKQTTGQTIATLRLDPGNGPRVSLIEIDFVEILQRSAVLEASLSVSKAVVAPEDKVTLSLKASHVDGKTVQSPCILGWTEGGAKKEVSVKAGKTTTVQRIATLSVPGVHHLGATLTCADKTSFKLTTSVICGRDTSLPISESLLGDRVRLDFIPEHSADGLGAARWMVRDPFEPAATGWRTAGWLLPLASLTTLTDGIARTREPRFNVVSVTREAAILESDSGDVRVEFHLKRQHGLEAIQVLASYTPQGDVKLLDFSGPVIRADRDRASAGEDRLGLFGGIEYLDRGWPSSSDRAVGEMLAERWMPHPFKITMPLMGVQQQGVTCGLFWQPRRHGDRPEDMPAATFVSPNFLDGQNNHLMKLALPGVGEHRRENERLAHEPMILPASSVLELDYLLYAEAQLPVTHLARRWYEWLGVPPSPPLPHTYEALYELIIENFSSTMFWESEGGWRQHWYMNHDTRYVPDIAATLVGHAAATNDPQLAHDVNLADRSVIDAAGTLASRHESMRKQAQYRISQMTLDGTWSYKDAPHIAEAAKRFTDGRYDTLGREGTITIGTCARPAVEILRYALLSGDPKAIDAGLKACEAMTRFHVPRGAQVWEVHVEIPDIRAAALAVEAFHLAYRLTGEPRWLEEASFWAWAGVPFVYSWHVPIEDKPGYLVATRDRDDWDRFSIPLEEVYQSGQPQVTPFGTVPVLGPSFYVVNWFGVLVQWCGLEWAEKVIELDNDLKDPMLRYIADGVVHSGFQQLIDQPPWTGLYPDSWHLRDNIAHAALIYAGLPLRCLQAQGHVPDYTSPWNRVLWARDRRWHVAGWGTPLALDPPVAGGGQWKASIRFLPSQPNELSVAPVDPPRRVMVDGAAVDQLDSSAEPDVHGWTYDHKHQLLYLRFQQESDRALVRVVW